jgi:hypothetical protein
LARKKKAIGNLARHLRGQVERISQCNMTALASSLENRAMLLSMVRHFYDP